MSAPVLSIAIIGAGPAGLMVAEILSAAGHRVDVYERMPSPARKFLMAGRGGLNLTHTESFDRFVHCYGDKSEVLRPMIEAFPPEALRAWADGLGAETFVGSSGRVFPKAMKASPLLRAWLRRLKTQGVTLRLRHDWRGWDDQGRLIFDHDDRTVTVEAHLTVVAAGGASWPRLGANGDWVSPFMAQNVPVVPLRPSNMGVFVPWSDHFKARFAGTPLKNIALIHGSVTVRGELMLTRDGIEGGAVYALSARLRDSFFEDGKATLTLDLRPDLTPEQVAQKWAARPRGESLSNALRKRLNLSPAAIAVVRETGTAPECIKAVTLTLTGVQGLERAISSAGGVPFDALTPDFAVKGLRNVYAVGEMLDWEAPTGGYLLQATFSTAVWVARSIIQNRGV